MCGILGGYWRAAPADLDTRLSSGLETIAHRGPNDRGYEIHRSERATVVLGQTRLSILDLSSGGHQPMLTEDGRFALTFNGEIYNYKEIREELAALGHAFRTASDTEVLLKAWVQWGEACLVRLIGMWALAIHDRRERTLTCVRDAFGIKPMFYAQEDGRLVFGSELPTVMALAGGNWSPNLQRGYDYLVHGRYDTTDETFIDGIHQLRPGWLIALDLDTGGVKHTRQWWTAPVARRSTLSFNDAAEALREAFLDSVRLHLRSDVPLGAALSGGIDSSAIVCAMRHVEPDAPIHTFSYIAEGSPLSEEAWVDTVREHTGAFAHKIVAGPDDLARDLDTIIRAQGEPFGSTSIYAQYRVYQLAREKGITVTLDGQGADELLAGYEGYPGQRMLSLLETPGEGVLAAARFAGRWGAWPGRSQTRAWMYLGRSVLPDTAYAAARSLMGRGSNPDWLNSDLLTDAGVVMREPRATRSSDAKGRRVIEDLAHSLQISGLPHLLRHGDRNSMRFSLESRVPFLTTPMADLVLSLPENYLISPSGETKSVFRAAMRGIVPDTILDRRDKIGFATPEHEWFLKLADQSREWLQDAEQVPILRREPLLKAFDAVIAGRAPFSWQAWRWINYVRWCRVFNLGS